METLVLTSQQKIAISRGISEIRLHFGKAKGDLIARAVPTYIYDIKTQKLTTIYSESVQTQLKKYDDECLKEVKNFLKTYGIKLEEGELSFIEEEK